MNKKTKEQLEKHLVKIRDMYDDVRLNTNKVSNYDDSHYNYVIFGYGGKVEIRVNEDEIVEIVYSLYPEIEYEWEK